MVVVVILFLLCYLALAREYHEKEYDGSRCKLERPNRMEHEAKNCYSFKGLQNPRTG